MADEVTRPAYDVEGHTTGVGPSDVGGGPLDVEGHSGTVGPSDVEGHSDRVGPSDVGDTAGLAPRTLGRAGGPLDVEGHTTGWPLGRWPLGRRGTHDRGWPLGTSAPWTLRDTAARSAHRSSLSK